MIFAIFSASGFNKTYAQKQHSEDSTVTTEHSAKKSTWMSAVLPGLGQAYNKKYWKIPVIWAGIGGLSYSIAYNYNNYSTYRDAYLFRIDDDSTTTDAYPGYSTEYLQTLKNSFRRNMELSVILTAALYALNIIDAAVDAHLYKFDISEDLSMNVKPAMLPAANSSKFMFNPGIRLTLKASDKKANKNYLK